MGYHAVLLLLDGKSNRVVTIQNDHILDYDIEEALQMKKPFDFELYRMALKFPFNSESRRPARPPAFL